MKKVVCLIAVLALTAGVYAQNVTITAAVDGDTITLGYDATGSAAMPVGFSFIVDAGTASLAAAGDVGLADSFFDVFIDFASDDPAAYQAGVIAEGQEATGIWSVAHPIAKADGAGAAAFPATVFAVSAAELANVAGIQATGTICTLKMTGTGTVCFSEDTLRGGVVDATGAAMAVTFDPECVNVPGGEVPCFVGQPQEAYWVSVGSPECWCWPRQCHGDADDFGQGKSPYAPVASYDLDVLKVAYGKTTAQLLADPTITVGGHAVAKACADFTRSIHGKAPNQAPVASPDLDILKSYYGKTTSLVPGDCAPANRKAAWSNLP